MDYAHFLQLCAKIGAQDTYTNSDHYPSRVRLRACACACVYIFIAKFAK